MIGYFYAATLAHGVVVEVDIGAFVESVVRGMLRRRGDVVMDICKPVSGSVKVASVGEADYLQCQERHFSLLRRHCARWCEFVCKLVAQTV